MLSVLVGMSHRLLLWNQLPITRAIQPSSASARRWLVALNSMLFFSSEVDFCCQTMCGHDLGYFVRNNQNYAHAFACLSLFKEHLQFRGFTTAKAEQNLPN